MNKIFLALTKGGQKTDIKGKNPNSSLKDIGSSTLKSTKKDQNQINKDIKEKQQKTRKSQMKKQFQKLQQKLKQTANDIQQTQQKLNIDLFLKRQKQKKQQYAKNINKKYQEQKKARQQKLYKKYNRDERNQNKNYEDGQGNQINEQNGQKNQDNLIQTKNVRSKVPLQFLKILQTQKLSISKTSSVLNGHFTIDDLLNDQKRKKLLFDNQKITQQQNQLLFNKNNANQIYSTSTIKKIADNMLQIQYFPIQYKQMILEPIEQYQNIMNALSLMPIHLSQKYYYHTKAQNQDYFLCRMFFNGQRKSILTNNLIQTRQFAHRHINIMSKVSGNRNFGPTIIQKCFRKVSANYQYLQLRQTIYTLFGLDMEVVQISNKNYLKENFQVILKFLIDSGQIIGFMNDNGHNETIYQKRIYKLKEVIEIVQFSQNEKKEEKKKKKNKENKKQTKQQEIHQQKKVKVVYHLQNPWKGLVLDSKGNNKFELLELFEKFNKMILIREYPKSYKCKRINFQLFSMGPLSITSNQWTKNNQYNFIVNVQMTMRIVMRKKLSSNAQSIINMNKQKDLDYQSNNLFGFLIFSIKQGQQKVTCLKMQSLITKTKSNDQIDGASYCGTFHKGNYIIIPYSNKMSKNSYQLFCLDFFIQKQQCVNFGKAIIHEWKWNMNNNQVSNNNNSKGKDNKVIQSLQSKQVIKKTIIEDVQMNKVTPQGISIEKLLGNLSEKKIVLCKELKFNDIIVPGKVQRFLVNPDIQILYDKAKKKGANNSKKNKQKQKSASDQVIAYEKQQALKFLLGYDLIQGQDIDRGLMMDYLQKQQDQLDFQNFGLGKQGITAIMQTLMAYPSIGKLNLASNDLDDSCIVFLCYYLQKANRVELRELNVKSNPFNKIGLNAIKGMMERFKNLRVVY